jgi:hypothetical protein
LAGVNPITRMTDCAEKGLERVEAKRGRRTKGNLEVIMEVIVSDTDVVTSVGDVHRSVVEVFAIVQVRIEPLTWSVPVLHQENLSHSLWSI